MYRGLIVLDRDGVINRGPKGPGTGPITFDEIEILPSVPQAVALLTYAGFAITVATNQPGAAKGEATKEILQKIHNIIISKAESEGGKILDSFICWHAGSDGCECRKPQPGMLLAAKLKFPTFASTPWMVGDRDVDIKAARAAGFNAAFIWGNSPFSLQTLSHLGLKPDFSGSDLSVFSRWLIDSDSASLKKDDKFFGTLPSREHRKPKGGLLTSN